MIYANISFLLIYALVCGPCLSFSHVWNPHNDRMHIVCIDCEKDLSNEGIWDILKPHVANFNQIGAGGVMGLIETTKIFPDLYIFSLNITDFYKLNYNFVSQYLIYGGGRDTFEHHVEAFVVDFKKSAEGVQNISCDDTKSTSYPTVKLMSRNVADNRFLYNFIRNYPHISAVELQREVDIIDREIHFTPKILVCDDKVYAHIPFDSILKSTVRDCQDFVNKYHNNLLAVVAPKPIEIDHNILAPIVLHQTPCNDEHIMRDDNYVKLRSCDGHKYALLKLLKYSKWWRVAIVSDNTPYSEKFEGEMTGLLKEKGISYTVERCIERDTGECSFVQALQTLKDFDTRVFIANIDESNYHRLDEDARAIWNRGNNLGSWIFRDRTFETKTETLDDIYSINIKFPVEEWVKFILEVNMEMRPEYDGSKRKSFYRKLKKKLEMNTHLTDDITYSITKNYGHILDITVKNSKASVIASTNYWSREDMDVTCSIRSGNFHKPCDDHNILIILVVLVVVAGCGLVAVISTNKFTTRRQYTNLS